MQGSVQGLKLCAPVGAASACRAASREGSEAVWPLGRRQHAGQCPGRGLRLHAWIASISKNWSKTCT